MRARRQTCCFTGSRPEKMDFDYERQPYQLEAMRRDLTCAIEQAAAAGYTDFVSGMSRGFDLWAAQAVLALRPTHPELRLICAIPFKSQSHGWEDAWRTVYGQVLRQADELHVLSERYHYGCYHVRDRYMVDCASRVICWYTGMPGGTQYTYQYARAQGCTIINLASCQLSFF